MSKAKKLREMQEEINNLKAELKRKDEIIKAFQKRARLMISDFVVKKSGDKKW